MEFSCFQFVKRMNGNLLDRWRPKYQQHLLPIREAYEWKHPEIRTGVRLTRRGLASNSWSVWMETIRGYLTPYNRCSTCFQFVKRMNGNVKHSASTTWAMKSSLKISCFQFVKRMNGNAGGRLEMQAQYRSTLASNSWSVWMETLYGASRCPIHQKLASNSWSVWMETLKILPYSCVPLSLLPIREAYEWKQRATCVFNWTKWTMTCFQFVKRMNGNGKLEWNSRYQHTLASNSWSVWMETFR